MLNAWPVLLALAMTGALAQQPAQPLQLVRSVALPGISGDFDHFAIDEKGGRLFLASEDNHTVEVFDLKTGQHVKSITGFGVPHAIFFLPETDRILVTDGDKGAIQILRAQDYAFLDRIDGFLGADSASLDQATGVLYVVTGGKDVHLDYSSLAAIDLKTKKKLGELRFDSNHVEALALESTSSRLFINITDKGEVAVVNRDTMREMGRWPVGVAGENSPMAYDEAHQRLFVVCRKPPMLVVMDSEDGRVITALPAAARSDDIAFDAHTGRIYVPGGDGRLSIFHQESANKYQLVGEVRTPHGAKTSLLVPSLGRYFVAVSPGDTKTMPRVLTFRVLP